MQKPNIDITDEELRTMLSNVVIPFVCDDMDILIRRAVNMELL